ncbi:MAG: peptide-methionine (R)-S-oxide reductase MsrB [Sphingomicrobium sp.]
MDIKPTPDDKTMMTRRFAIGAGSLALFGGFVAISRPGDAAGGKFAVQKSEAQWKAQLGAQRFAILRQEGTERPFSSPLLKEKRRGTYACAGCGQPVFLSATKFDSGTGWPSFFREIPGKVAFRNDSSLGMSRTEEHCSRCGGHLGHVFDDGPRPTGKRHCINGLSLTFRSA